MNENRKEIPILFSTEMVQAILAERKTMTRRTRGLEEINKNPDEWEFCNIVLHVSTKRHGALFKNKKYPNKIVFIKSPYGYNGDLLWVRESFFDCSAFRNAPIFSGIERNIVYKSDTDHIGCHHWKPSIHMPKAAARIWLQVKTITVERLQDISEEDAISEGVFVFEPGEAYKDYKYDTLGSFMRAKGSFFSLWDKINGEESLKANPWVWVVKFKVLSTTGKPAIL